MRYGTCFLCGKTGWLEEHHVYPGPFRDKSEKYGLKVGLCGESCHRNGRYAAHQCRETSDALKQFWQIKYMMAHKASVADFRAAFGKNYLELDYYDDERSYPMEIAPPGYLFNEYNRERFTPPYFQHMDRVGTARIAQILQHYEDMGNPVVLCCYEDVRKPGEWCHRLVFAEWWLQRTGEMIEELPDPSPNKWAKQPEPQKAVEPDAVQMKMW